MFYLSYFISEFVKNKFNKFKTNYVINLYLLFSLFCFLSCLWTIDPNESFGRCITLFLITINIFISYNTIKNYQLLNLVFYSIIVVTYVNFLISFGLLGYSAEFYNFWRFQGTRYNPNDLAILMIFSVLSSIILSSRVYKKFNSIIQFIIFLNVPISIFIIFLLLMSKKGIIFGGILFFLFFLKSFINIKDKKIILNYFLIVLAIYLVQDYISFEYNIINQLNLVLARLTEFFYFEGTSTEQRIDYIYLGYDMFKNKILFGNGIGAFKSIYGTYSHNNYIDLLSGVGIVGFSIYYSIFIKLLERFKSFLYFKKNFIYFIYILVLLAMDTAYVGYYSKFNILMLLVLSIFLESANETN